MSCWNKDEFDWMRREVTHCEQCHTTYFLTEEDGEVTRCPKCDILTQRGYMSNLSGQVRLHLPKKGWDG